MNKFWIIFLSSISFVLSIITIEEFGQFSERVFLTSLLIQTTSIYFIFNKPSEPFSLFKIFYLFSFFFFGFAPLMQFYGRVQLFGSRPLLESEYFFMNVLIIFILYLYNALYIFFYERGLRNQTIRFSQLWVIKGKLNYLQVFFLIVLSLISFLVVFKANNYSILSMLIRGGEFKETTVESTTSHLIIYRFFQPLSIMSFFYYLTSPSKNRIVASLLGLIAIITCFPLGMARFSAAALYIPFVLLTIPILRKKNVFSLSFILSLLVLFPLLDNFRNFSSTSTKINLDMRMFVQGHFDSYQNFTLILTENIITWGRQLLGVFFFFVPRSIWPNKPIGSGSFISDKLGMTLSNISCNFFAEGYINFGFVGLFIFLIIMAYFSARLDKLYWYYVDSQENSYYRILYYLLIGMLFFVLRGDLLSSFAFTIGFITTITIVNVVAKINANN